MRLPMKNERRVTLTSVPRFVRLRLRISATSPRRLNVNGPPKLALIRKKNLISRYGAFSPSPLLRINAREWLRSYSIFAMAKRPDEHTPCANITIILPAKLRGNNILRLKMIRAICTTDE